MERYNFRTTRSLADAFPALRVRYSQRNFSAIRGLSFGNEF
jgi:hypothetical protein